MIITRTPMRIGLFGGGTDLPAYCDRHIGAVVNATVDKYVYITLHEHFDRQVRCAYSELETVPTAAELRHTRARACLEFMGVETGVEVTSVADVPAGSGLGASSAYTVGLLHALRQREFDKTGERRITALAQAASHIEIDLLGEPVGRQDQHAAAAGGLNLWLFGANGKVQRIAGCDDVLERLGDHLSLYWTGGTRSASELLAEQSRATREDKRVEDALTEMADLALTGWHYLERGDFEGAAAALNLSWLIKRELTPSIETGEMISAHQAALKAGAWAGKVCGAGGGGFFLVMHPPDYSEPKAVIPKLDKAMAPWRRVPFKLTSVGSEIVYDDNGRMEGC